MGDVLEGSVSVVEEELVASALAAHPPKRLLWLAVAAAKSADLGHVTLGTYPAAVPKEYLLPPESFASRESIGRFTDAAVEAGLRQ